MSFKLVSLYINDTYENNSMFTLSVNSSIVKYPGYSKTEFNRYVFNKSDGKLLSNDDVVNLLGLSMDNIINNIQEGFKKKSLSI